MAAMHVVDYLIFIVTMLLSFSIGIYFACRKVNTSTESYLLANRKMNIAPIATSLLVSVISAISILGNASEMYYYGSAFIFAILGWGLSLFVTSLTIVPLVHSLKLVSIHEYFLMRYKVKGIVYLGTFLQTLTGCFINGIVLFGPAIMLESMADIPVWAGMLVLGLVSTIYTTIGGFQAVIWSDVFQAIVMLFGLILINILGTIKIGGAKEVWQIYYDQGRLNMSWGGSPFVRSTVWGFLIGMFINVANFAGVSQTSVQRFCSLPTIRDAQRALWYSIPGLFIIQSLTCVAGVVAFSYFTKIGCDPLASGQITNNNQVVPFFIIEVLNYPGIPGVFMGCILCGSFSNLSSSYNSISALIWEDVIKDVLSSRNLSEMHKARITKFLSFLAGIAAILTGFCISQLGGTLIQIALGINSIALLPVTILFILGATSRRTTWKTALIGAILPSCFLAWLNIGSNISGLVQKHLPTVTTNCNMLLTTHDNFTTLSPGNEYLLPEALGTTSVVQEYADDDSVFILYKMFYMLYAPLGLFMGVFLGTILSFIPGLQNTEEVDAKLLFPFIRNLLTRAGYLKYSEEKNGTYVLKEKDGMTISETI